MKKLFKKSTALLLTMLMLVSLFSISAFATESTEGTIVGITGTWTYTTNTDGETSTITITSFNTLNNSDVNVTETTVLSTINYTDVTAIADNAFKDVTGIEEVNINGPVTTIGAYAFSGCTSLTKISLYDVTSVGKDAFVTGSESLTIIYDSTIADFIAIEGIMDSLSADTTIITTDGTATFDGDRFSYTAYSATGSSSTVFISDLGWSYIYNDDNTVMITGYIGSNTDVTVPETIDNVAVTSMQYLTFYYNTTVTSVTIPTSITSIGWRIVDSDVSITYQGTFDKICDIDGISDAFLTGTTVITTDKTVVVEDYIFTDYEWITVEGIEGGQILFSAEIGAIISSETTITSANIPNTINDVAVTNIGIGAFLYCESLTSVTIPTSVTTIGSSAFDCCDSLVSIILPISVTSIDAGAFYTVANCYYVGTETQWNEIELSEYAFNSDVVIIYNYGVTTDDEDADLTAAKEELYKLENITITADELEEIIEQGIALGYVSESDDNGSRLDYFFSSEYLENIDLPEGYGFYRSYYDVPEDYPYEDVQVEIWILEDTVSLYDDWGVCDHSITITVTGTITSTDDKDTSVDTDTTTTVTTESTASVEIALDEESVTSVFKAEELASGEDLKVVLSVNEAEEFTEAEQTAIDELVATLEETYELALILDIDLTKYIGDTATSLTDLDEEITITIDIPEELQGKDLVIIRVHENADGTFTTDILTDTDDDDETFTFKTDKFSTYAIAEVAETETHDTTSDDETEEDEETALDVPQTGDTSTNILVVVAMFTSLLGIVYISRKKLVK